MFFAAYHLMSESRTKLSTWDKLTDNVLQQLLYKPVTEQTQLTTSPESTLVQAT